ncbi:MAG TPA: GNAT family N-acetyltransferase, partial [Candidatus Elarobacter sp.]|nr:GNAT family N-acetyltransferase [Candidatus Elarobacter sp.]
MQPIANGSVSNGASLESAALENAMLAGYDGDVRNQIRQALRNGLRVTPYVLDREAGGDETERAYRRYVPVHAESFLRTGMTPHRLDYWLGLSEAVQRGGGTDLVVLVSDADGADVAAVTC